MGRTVAATVIALAGLAAGCDRPGPLSAAARGNLPPPPAAPAWAAPLIGQALASAYPGEARCIGYVDHPAERFKNSRKVLGWAWNAGAGRTVDRLAVVDAAGRVRGFGEGGLERPDVPAAMPEVRSGTTGWWVIAPTAERTYVVYGLDEAARTACRIAEVRP